MISNEELEAVAKELDVVATWHTGGRRAKVEKLTARLRGQTPTPLPPPGGTGEPIPTPTDF